MHENWTAAGERAAIALETSNGARLSYGELRELVGCAAAALSAMGAGPGRVVAVRVREPGGALVAMLAALEAGACVLPVDARMGEAGLADVLARARPALLVRGAELDGRLAVDGLGAPRQLDEEAALLLFTSGSSGEPKGVVLGRAAVAANVEAILGYLPVKACRRTAIVLPLSYSYALVGQALVTLRAGGTALMFADMGFPTVQVEAMARAGASGLSSVPPSLRWICQAALELPPDERPRLGYVASAGAPLDATTRRLIAEAFPEARRFNQYGLTEACPRVTAIADDEPAFALGSVGRALPGLTVRALGPDGTPLPPGGTGELVVEGPSVMHGYLDDPAGTARAVGPYGLRTGDTGKVDADGYVWVLGRHDGVVKCGGERVSVEEVAAVVRRAEGVSDAAVVAVPDEVLGSRLIAYVETAIPDVVARVSEATRRHLPAAKRPHRIVAVSELPRGPHGKVDLAALRRRAEAG